MTAQPETFADYIAGLLDFDKEKLAQLGEIVAEISEATEKQHSLGCEPQRAQAAYGVASTAFLSAPNDQTFKALYDATLHKIVVAQMGVGVVHSDTLSDVPYQIVMRKHPASRQLCIDLLESVLPPLEAEHARLSEEQKKSFKFFGLKEAPSHPALKNIESILSDLGRAIKHAKTARDYIEFTNSTIQRFTNIADGKLTTSLPYVP